MMSIFLKIRHFLPDFFFIFVFFYLESTRSQNFSHNGAQKTFAQKIPLKIEGKKSSDWNVWGVYINVFGSRESEYAVGFTIRCAFIEILPFFRNVILITKEWRVNIQNGLQIRDQRPQFSNNWLLTRSNSTISEKMYRIFN